MATPLLRRPPCAKRPVSLGTALCWCLLSLFCPCSCSLVLAVSMGKVEASATHEAIPPNTKGLRSSTLGMADEQGLSHSAGDKLIAETCLLPLARAASSTEPSVSIWASLLLFGVAEGLEVGGVERRLRPGETVDAHSTYYRYFGVDAAPTPKCANCKMRNALALLLICFASALSSSCSSCSSETRQLSKENRKSYRRRKAVSPKQDGQKRGEEGAVQTWALAGRAILLPSPALGSNERGDKLNLK